MRNTIGLRLSLGFLVLVILLLAVGGVGVWYSTRVNAAIGEVRLQTDRLVDLVSLQAGIENAEKSLEASLGETEDEMSPEELASLLASTKVYIAISESYLTAMIEKTDALRASINVTVEEAQQAQQTSSLIILIISAVAVVLAIVLAVLITRSITRPVSYLVRTADNLSTGDLGTRVEAHSKDEVGELAESLERMRVSLKAVMDRIRAGA